MKVTLDEIRELRKRLNENRIKNEALVTQARLIREHCREIRELCRNSSYHFAESRQIQLSNSAPVD